LIRFPFENFKFSIKFSTQFDSNNRKHLQSFPSSKSERKKFPHIPFTVNCSRNKIVKNSRNVNGKSFQLSSDALSLSSAGVFFKNWNRTRVQHWSMMSFFTRPSEISQIFHRFLHSSSLLAMPIVNGWKDSKYFAPDEEVFKEIHHKMGKRQANCLAS
jgi:hypothetical protein